MRIKYTKNRQKEEGPQGYDNLENTPLLYASSAVITEIEDRKKIIEILILQYREEYNKLHYCGTKK
jgi:hypothetical protein